MRSGTVLHIAKVKGWWKRRPGAMVIYYDWKCGTAGEGMNGHSKSGNGIGLMISREHLAHFYQDAYDMSALPLQRAGSRLLSPFPTSVVE